MAWVRPSACPYRLWTACRCSDDRGVSPILASFPIIRSSRPCRDLKQRGVLRQVRGRSAVAVIGPGLDFADKNQESAFDYYPQQTVQPFALYDSLVRLGLAKANALSLSIFDISSRVIDHHSARPQARLKEHLGYVIQLPRDVPCVPGRRNSLLIGVRSVTGLEARYRRFSRRRSLPVSKREPFEYARRLCQCCEAIDLTTSFLSAPISRRRTASTSLSVPISFSTTTHSSRRSLSRTPGPC